MKITYLILGFTLLVPRFISAQVGIGTDSPAATLDVVGQATVTSSLDGIIPPRITGDQLDDKTYTSNQTGAIIYVTAADTAPAGQTINVTSAGYYFFNGTGWIAISDESSKISVENELFFEDSSFCYVSMRINTTNYKVVRYSKSNVNSEAEASGTGTQPTTLAAIQLLTFS